MIGPGRAHGGAHAAHGGVADEENEQGEFQGILPTGREVTLSAIDIFRIADGKIAEAWVLRDDLGMLQQLGVVPPPGGAGG